MKRTVLILLMAGAAAPAGAEELARPARYGARPVVNQHFNQNVSGAHPYAPYDPMLMASTGTRQIREGTPVDYRAAEFASTYPWHGPYYHTEYGRPVALVVPPNARMQTKYSWGVANTTMTPIWHQYHRAQPRGGYGGMVGGGYGLQPTPQWPSHTDQFGVYYVRGPWGQRW